MSKIDKLAGAMLLLGSPTGLALTIAADDKSWETLPKGLYSAAWMIPGIVTSPFFLAGWGLSLFSNKK